jgi:hypothetical protein
VICHVGTDHKPFHRTQEGQDEEFLLVAAVGRVDEAAGVVVMELWRYGVLALWPADELHLVVSD